MKLTKIFSIPSVFRVFTRSIRMKILLPVAAILVLLFVGLSYYSLTFALHEARINLNTKTDSVSMLAAFAFGKPVAQRDKNQLAPLAVAIQSVPDVSGFAVYDISGNYVIGHNVEPRRVGIDELLAGPKVKEINDHVVVVQQLFDVDAEKGGDAKMPAGALWIDFSNEKAQARANGARARHILIAVIGFVPIMLLLGWVLSRLTGPIRELTRVTTEIVSKGDLTQRIRVSSNDEVGQLAKAFSQMVEKLREIPRRLQDTTQMLVTSVESLGKSTSEQSQTLTRQAVAVQETQVTVHQIKQTSLLAAQKAEMVLKVTERADELSRSGELAISQSLGGMSDIREQVVEIAQKIGELEERTRQIGVITETVKDLADQSNMLALNAAIEAVRSGEHGKGFAVVAREIRSLADQSIQATTRVRQILEDISNAIRAAVSITETGAQKMEGGLAQMKTSGENLRELSSIVKDNAAAVRQIAAAVSQQNAGVTQIVSAVTDLNKMMEETLGSLEHTAQSVVALRDVSTQVSNMVGGFRL